MIQLAAGIAIVAGVVGFITGVDYANAKCEAAKVPQIQREAEGVKRQATESNQVETVYVDRIQRVEVPVDRVRRVLVAGVCPAADPRVLPGGNADLAADGAAEGPADAEIVERIARDAESCIRNAEQLTALQALIRANTEEAPQ